VKLEPKISTTRSLIIGCCIYVHMCIHLINIKKFSRGVIHFMLPVPRSLFRFTK
jgi:hypothetical protein